MAFTLPGPGGEGWWWEEDMGVWRLISGPGRQEGEAREEPRDGQPRERAVRNRDGEAGRAPDTCQARPEEKEKEVDPSSCIHLSERNGRYAAERYRIPGERHSSGGDL